MAEDIVSQLRSVDVSWTYEGELCAWAADHIEKLEAALQKKNAHLHKLILVHKGEIPKDEIYGVPVMCDGERIFPRLADDVVLYAARTTKGD
jgi:hypothetical protein